MAFSPDGARLATGGTDNNVHVWDATTGQSIESLQGHSDRVRGVAFRPDGNCLASASDDKTVRVWDTTIGRLVRTLEGHTGPVRSVAFSADGKQLASAGGNVGGADSEPGGEVKIWDLKTGEPIRTFLQGQPAELGNVAFSPDGKRLASVGGSGIVKVWEVSNGREVFSLQRDSSNVTATAFSPNGERLVSAGWLGWIHVWDATTGQRLAILKDHASNVWSLEFSPDGTRLVSAGGDGTVKIWDMETYQQVISLIGYTRRSRGSVIFSPDGTRLASATTDGAVRMWDGRPWVPEAPAEREALGLLDYLFAKPLRKADVIEYLKTSPTIRSEARQMALVERYDEETDPKKYHDAAESVIRHPYSNALMCQFAVAQMRAACELAPENAAYRIALGVAQYRLGKFQSERYQEALATLAKCDQDHPTTLAFLALTQHELGHKDEARATLDRLRNSRKNEEQAGEDAVPAYVREAETRIGVPQ